MSYISELEEAKAMYAEMLANTKEANKIADYSSKIQVLNMRIEKAKSETLVFFDSLPNNPITLNKKILFKRGSEGI